PRPGLQGAARASADRPGSAGRGADREPPRRGQRAPAAVRAARGDGVTEPVVLAIDGGNSKTDLALVRADGGLLSLVRGAQSSPHHLGLDGSLAVLSELLAQATTEAGLPNGDGPVADVGRLYLAGVDLPSEEEEMAAAAHARRFADRITVGNDEIAAGIVARLAGEVVTMIRVTLERLDLTNAPVDVVLGGGLMQSQDERLISAVVSGLQDVAPAAVVKVTSTPPVVGAALMGLD